MKPKPFPANRLTVSYKAKQRGFRTTDELEDLEGVLGQSRALEAIRFGTEIDSPGYNLYLLGDEGTGKHEVILDFLQEKAGKMDDPWDWVYVHNFETSHKPRALRIPSGRGRELASTMEQFVEDIRASVPAFLENEENQSRLRAVQEEYQHKPETAFEELRKYAEEHQFALIRTPMGFGFAPMIGDEVAKPEVYDKLPKANRQRMEADIEDLQEKLQDIIKRVPIWDKERRVALRKLYSEMTAIAIDSSIEQVIEQFRDLPEVLDYLDVVHRDLIENFHSIQMSEQRASETEPPHEGIPSSVEIGGFERYKVNPVVAHDESSGAPVVYEDNPTISNLMGRVEYISRYGALVTDFSLIKAGALHRANGGFIIFDAAKLLWQPFSWSSLKRALKGGKISIESAGQMLGLINTISLEPEPIGLDVKVILIGNRLLYYLLSELDPEFQDLFKVQVDFDSDMELNEDHEALFPRMIAARARKDGLRPLAPAAVALVMQHAVRLAGDRKKISIHMRSVSDLLHEAEFYAKQSNARRIGEQHVRKAIDTKIERADRLRDRVYESITRGFVLIDTEGEAVGQVNGLSVLELGGFAFGRPTRITARVRLGTGKVIDIEREVELGGPLHSKGVMILSGFLAARYAVNIPLSLSATLVFEQSYGGVEGDSASSAELYALLSALAEAPLRQDLAITGSVNQNGDVQVIGGVNEKIEGFFDICQRRGLTGTQGVLIPAANADHLILRDEVIEAVRKGKFHIYPVRSVDEGLALLTGLNPGKRNSKGRYPKGSMNDRVERRLVAFARARRQFARRDDGKGGG